MSFVRKLVVGRAIGLSRSFSVTATNNDTYSCKLLVIGGGYGGCSIAAKFTRRLGKDAVIILEPNKNHYYQPLWTLVGAGLASVEDSRRLNADVLPKKAKWVVDYAESIIPEKNLVKTREGHQINYEYLIIAAGICNNYARFPDQFIVVGCAITGCLIRHHAGQTQTPGMLEALQDKSSGVSSIYAPEFCESTWRDIKHFKGGNAIFTFPDSPLKCPGAPQKIMYLAESYFTKANVRSKSKVTYTTCLPTIFGIKKYSDELEKVAKRKGVCVEYKTILKSIRPDKKEAVFIRKDDKSENEIVMEYDMLHVTPTMFTPEFLRKNVSLADQSGYLDVDKFTLQHKKFPNVWGIGDCTNTPNSKTAAAIATQSKVLEHNLLSTMKKDSPKEKYNGYGACPLLTSYNTCIMAEFIYDGVVRETFPYDQSKESKIAFLMKQRLFPPLYWHVMLKGYYNGPEFVRKIMKPFSN